MGGIVSSITDAIGLTDHEGQRRAQANAAQAAENANELSRENMEFQKQQYEDWKNIYGDIQENLGQYYKNLGPERITTLGLQQQQRAYQDTQSKIKQTLAQRGIGDSKYEGYLQTVVDSQNNIQRANIRASAEENVIKQQMGFLGLGLGQGQSLLGNINNATNTGVNSFSNQASMYSGQANNLAQHNSSLIRNIYDDASSYIGLKLGGG
jgi:hypothetical protein